MTHPIDPPSPIFSDAKCSSGARVDSAGGLPFPGIRDNYRIVRLEIPGGVKDPGYVTRVDVIKTLVEESRNVDRLDRFSLIGSQNRCDVLFNNVDNCAQLTIASLVLLKVASFLHSKF